MALADQIVQAESGDDPNARNPNSSAAGPGQFIDATWLSMVGKYRPDLAQGKSRQEILALRSDPALSRQMTQAYAGENAQALSAAGVTPSPGSLYLAHFAGPRGAVSVLTAAPDTPAADVLGQGAVKANPFLRNMTVADLRAWAAGKMGGTAAQSAAPVAPQPSAAIGGGAPTGMLSGLPTVPTAPAGPSPLDQSLEAVQGIPGMLAQMSTPADLPGPLTINSAPAPGLDRAALSRMADNPRIALRQRLLAAMAAPPVPGA